MQQNHEDVMNARHGHVGIKTSLTRSELVLGEDVYRLGTEVARC